MTSDLPLAVEYPQEHSHGNLCASPPFAGSAVTETLVCVVNAVVSALGGRKITSIQ